MTLDEFRSIPGNRQQEYVAQPLSYRGLRPNSRNYTEPYLVHDNT